MKKKLLLLTLAAVLPLAACGKKDDDTPAGSSEAEIRATALTESYTGFAKLIMGEQQATAMKPFLASGAKVVSPYEVDIEKVYTHILSIGDTVDEAEEESEALVGVATEIKQMKTEGLIDDTVYYFLGFGDGMLKASAQKTGATNPEVAATLAKIDAEAERIASNICGLIDCALDVYSEVSDPMFLPNILSAYDTNTEKVVGTALKVAISTITSVYEKLEPAKANLEYLSDLVLPVVNVVVPNVPKEVNIVFDYVKASDVIGVAFDAVTFVVNSLKSLNLNNDYFSYIDHIDNPIENVAYAVLGFVEHTKQLLLESISDEKLTEAVNKVVEIGLGIAGDILEENEIELPEEIEELLASDTPKSLLLATAKLSLDLLGFDLETVNAKSLARLVPSIVEVVSKENEITEFFGTSIYDELPDAVKAFVNEKYEVKSEQTQIETHYSFYGIEEGKQHSFTKVSIVFDGESLYSYNYENTQFVSLEVLAEPIYAVLSELAEQDEKLTLILNDVYAMLGAGYDVLAAIEEFIKIPEEVSPILDIILSIVEENSESFTTVVLDLVDVIKDLFGSFVTTTQLEADLDFTDFVFTIFNATFDVQTLLSLKLDESRLAHVKQLCKDVYKLLVDLKMENVVVPLILSLMEVTGVEITDEDSFAEFFYGIAKSFLVEGKIPDILMGQEPPQEK